MTPQQEQAIIRLRELCGKSREALKGAVLPIVEENLQTIIDCTLELDPTLAHGSIVGSFIGNMLSEFICEIEQTLPGFMAMVVAAHAHLNDAPVMLLVRPLDEPKRDPEAN